jgi:hypothetical protein
MTWSDFYSSDAFRPAVVAGGLVLGMFGLFVLHLGTYLEDRKRIRDLESSYRGEPNSDGKKI